MDHDSIVKILMADGLPVAGTLEYCAPEESEIYYPANYLIYVEKGCLRLHVNEQAYAVRGGEFLLVRKFTNATYYKELEENQDGFREHIFILYDDFIKEVIGAFLPPNGSGQEPYRVTKLARSPILKGLFKSLEVYLEANIVPDHSVMILKTREALHGLLQAKPELIHTFIDFSRPEKADLLRFMENNFTQKLSLEHFARLTGRSLATFNRDFRKVFNCPPYQWIKQQRLLLAKRLLTFTPKIPSAVYLEVGFEDLAHFSRSFKKQFGINPSEVQKELNR